MKLRILNIFASLLITACAITSCLDDYDTEYELSADACITAFSIKDSIITYYQSKIGDKDTTLSTAVVGAEYPFIISHTDGLIYNPDSLPYGTDVSKVVVDIISDYYLYIVAETDSLWEQKDSLNFEQPIQFKVLAQNGVFGRTYTAKINVHQQDPEVMTWEKMSNNFSTEIKAQKAIYTNKQIYIFAEQGSKVAMTCTTDGKVWSDLKAIDIPIKADYSSVMAWGNQFYILANQELYTSTNGLNWNKVETGVSIARLLANSQTANSQKIMGIDTDNYFIGSEDGILWNRYEAVPESFPTTKTSYVSYELDTNSEISRTILVGNDELSTDTTTSAWMQISTENSWNELYLERQIFACPKLENLSLIRYNNLLYIFGGPGRRNSDIAPFSNFFASEDSGITWKIINKNVMFPDEFEDLYEQTDGQFSFVVDDNQYLWIIWSQIGEVWRGRINKLGFDKQ